ncbi:MAG: hypothetical protein Q7R41_06100, partial [Phycisphaerales bacterium]|nr:hypothetical protein [Phycisphaerales bacterium]
MFFTFFSAPGDAGDATIDKMSRRRPEADRPAIPRTNRRTGSVQTLVSLVIRLVSGKNGNGAPRFAANPLECLP